MLTCTYMTKERTEGLNGLEFFFVKSVFFVCMSPFGMCAIPGEDGVHPCPIPSRSLPMIEPIFFGLWHDLD